MLNPRDLSPGQEQYENYRGFDKKLLVQYDYRVRDGELFSCVRKSLEECRKARDAWLHNKTVCEVIR